MGLDGFHEVYSNLEYLVFPVHFSTNIMSDLVNLSGEMET